MEPDTGQFGEIGQPKIKKSGNIPHELVGTTAYGCKNPSIRTVPVLVGGEGPQLQWVLRRERSSAPRKRLSLPRGVG